MSFSWMAWTLPTALFFLTILVLLAGLSVWEYFVPGALRAPACCASRRRAATVSSSRCWGQRSFISHGWALSDPACGGLLASP